MTLRIELSEAAYAALIAHAQSQNKEASVVAGDQLESLYADCEPEVIQVIAEALNEDGSNDISLEEYAAEVRERRRRRDAAKTTRAVA